jgi:hypothetical protein
MKLGEKLYFDEVDIEKSDISKHKNIEEAHIYSCVDW